jgi:hypothetical protein
MVDEKLEVWFLKDICLKVNNKKPSKKAHDLRELIFFVYFPGKEFAAVHLLLLASNFELICYSSTDSQCRLPLVEIQVSICLYLKGQSQVIFFVFLAIKVSTLYMAVCGLQIEILLTLSRKYFLHISMNTFNKLTDLSESHRCFEAYSLLVSSFWSFSLKVAKELLAIVRTGC